MMRLDSGLHNKSLIQNTHLYSNWFAEWYLSNGKCDNEHNKTVSFNNCMLRIPGSFNSKNNVQVRIMQKWNGTSKVPLHLLYSKFLANPVNQD